MSNVNARIRQQDATELAHGYSKTMRMVEILSIVLFFAGEAYIAWRVLPHLSAHPWLIGVAAFVGYLGADFVSGLVHWMADTWGSTKMPIIGPALLRPFREHHVDPKAITRHDFIETNGNNCMVSLSVILIGVFLPLESPWALGFTVFIASMVWFVMLTNQFHKWAHLDEQDTPPLIAFLQKSRLILSRPHHQIHHTPPYHSYYCITTGWLNWPLHVTRFYRGLERAITATTGLLPRADDIGEEAAAALVAQELGGTEPAAATKIASSTAP